MKYFKLEQSRTADVYEITHENYLKYIKRKPPYEHKNDNGKLSQYAFCPSCLNPIQLIGIIRPRKVLPYGRHTGKEIEELGKWNQQMYEYCPFTVRNVTIQRDEDDRIPVNEYIRELYYLLKEQFDRVVYVTEKELDIKCSPAFWRKALRQFVASEAYCYPRLTETNLPYLFAYFGVHFQNIYGQRVLVGSDIYNALNGYKGIKIEILDENKYGQIRSADHEYVNLHFRLTDHHLSAREGEPLVETVMFCIDDRNANETIFEKEIMVKQDFFMRLVNKQGNDDKRNKELLSISYEEMKDEPQ